MSEIIIQRVKQSIGKFVTIFLKNGFRYSGKITNCDEDYVEILEERYGLKIIQLIDISEINIPIGKVGEWSVRNVVRGILRSGKVVKLMKV